MLSFARRSASEPAFDHANLGDHYGSFNELAAGERIGHLPVRVGLFTRIVRSLVVLMVLLAAGWGVAAHPFIVTEWLPGQIGAIASAMDTRGHRTATPSTPTDPMPAPVPEETLAAASSTVPPPLPPPPPAPTAKETAPPPAPTAPAAPAPTVVEDRPVAPKATAYEPTAGSDIEDVAYIPPKPDPDDIFQMRAMAAGLHPSLSRVLLARLSAADYRNARVAIRNAIAAKSENGSFVWPKKRQGGLAIFEVRFVYTSTPNCRRYVVKIAKDGWLTTAAPMEKCGTPDRTRSARTAHR